MVGSGRPQCAAAKPRSRQRGQNMTDRWNIIGHDWAADLLREQIARQSLHHAYLFAGPPGVGRRTLALRFAQALNCSNPPQPGIPCGVCWDCVQLMKGEHPDLVELEAQPKEGTPPAIDRLGNRRSGLTLEAEPVRDSRLLLSLKPYRAAYRVAIYRYFEEASLQAANALLKTLEETPASSIMILTADSVEAMLPTVASRCEVLRLQPVPAPVLEAWLQAQGAEHDLARIIASISGGRPGYALRLLQRSEAFSYRQTKLDELQSLLPATRAQKFAYADRLAKDKNAMRGVLMLWLSMWRDVL